MNAKILVSTDFSEASYDAMRLAHDIAKNDRATLALIHVVPHLATAADQSILDWLRDKAPKAAEMEKLTRETLAGKVAELQAEGLQVESYLEEGEPHAAIVRRAEEAQATLVVVGSHGRTGLKRMLLGSVAEQVVRYAHTPVLVARSGPMEGPVVTGTDLSEAARPGLVEAARLAAASKSELVVLHVVNMGWFGRAAVGVTASALSTAMNDTAAFKEARESVDAEIKAATEGLDVKVTVEVVAGDPAVVLVERAEAVKARLVVTSTHGRTGLKRALLGSVAERVVRLASTSVLVFRGVQS